MSDRGAPIYLDYNASAPVRPEVAAVVSAVLECGGNPSSVHQWGRRARQTVEHARAHVAALVGADPASVIFTGGGTEANNMAIFGAPAGRILISAIEHDSVRETASASPVAREIIPVDISGAVNVGALEELLKAQTGPALVAVMLANNETGAIQPFRAVADIARAHGATVHCDAVQAAGKIAVDMVDLGADTLSLSAHKIGGPQGVGALIARPGLDLEPMMHGGRQERGRRSGTENVAGIAGFGEAARLARRGLDDYAGLEVLRDRLESRVTDRAPDARVHGAGGPRLPNTSCLSMPGVASETQVMAFDLEGVMISAGAACSSGKVHASDVLTAMGTPPAEAASAIRVSLGWATTAGDIERFTEVWLALYDRLAAREAAAVGGRHG